MATDLSGKTCIVTGASRGIGRGCAVALGSAGCRVAVNYRERADEAARAMGSKMPSRASE